MINRFRDEYAFLSNFYPSEIRIQGATYPTVEHAFQALKTDDPSEREQIRQAKTPAIAKQLGRHVTLRANWDEVKVSLMRVLVLAKFTSDSVLQAQLLATGDVELVEGNIWGDRFWGVSGGKGRNELGKILMSVRAELAG